MHVDDFVSNRITDPDASFFLLLHRLPATMQLKFKKYLKKYQLTCTYEGNLWYIIGASRMGDVWLSKTSELPYQERVDIEKCSNFSLSEKRSITE